MILPLCALCGGLLTQRGRRGRTDGVVIVDHTQEPTRPRYGWHRDCEARDELRMPLAPEQIAVVEARGVGRVVRRKRPAGHPTGRVDAEAERVQADRGAV